MQTGFELAYIGVETDARAAMDSFFGDVIGLTPGQTDAARSTWRNDQKVQRIIIHDGPANDAVYFGFEAANSAVFTDAIDRLRTAGCAVTHGTSDELAGRMVEDLAYTMTPWGTRVEIVIGLAGTEPLASTLVTGGFLTSRVGFGHVVFGVENLDDADRFTREALGLIQSDWLVTEEIAPVPVTARFYHCNRRHHTLALAGLPAGGPPQRLHHIMVETNTMDDVGRAYDRAVEARVPIAMTIGKHDNDKMTSFYAVTPAGFMFEVGWGARMIVDRWSENRQYSSVSEWGHKSPARLAY